MSATYLKVKIKSLAAEAAIIKREENRHKHFRLVEQAHPENRDLMVLVSKRKPIHPDSISLVNGLADHRKRIVRSEQRATLVAYGFLRGRTFAQMEPQAKSLPSRERVEKMVTRYGGSKVLTEFKAFWAEAEAHVKNNTLAKAAVVA